jgi:circadian clock protein KaiC
MAGKQSEDGTLKLNETGIAGLDEIFGGGLPSGNIVLVQGTPGTGKTTLSLEFIYRGALERDEPGVIITFEMSPAKLMRDAHSFGWDLAKLQAENKLKIVYTSPAVLLQELQSDDGVLATSIASMKAKRVAIDGMSPLRLYTEIASKPFRECLQLLVETLQRFNVTALLSHEIGSSDGVFGPEAFVCDTILTLRQDPLERGVHRSLEIAKSRGQDFISGRHTLRIEKGQGVRIYPRAYSRPADNTSHQDQPTSSKKSSVGISALDAMFGGGVYDGSITLVVGISGTGKTVTGTQFLEAGAREGKRGLLVTLDEHPAQILRNAKSLKLDIAKQVDDGMVFIYYDSPLELEIDVHFHRIKELIEKQNIERVVIDSLAAYEAATPKESRNFIYALATFLKDRLITAFFNYETPELLGISQISQDLKASTVVDNIVLLNYVEVSTLLRRAITVPKARGSRPTQNTREFVITQGGIALIDEESGDASKIEAVPQLPFSSYYGVLARSPTRRSPVIEESLSTGQGLPKSPILNVDSNAGDSQKEKSAFDG